MPAAPSVVLIDRAPVQARQVSPAASSSEAASLGGKPAKTPIIAGSICGGVVFIAWLVGLAIYIHKRRRRQKQKRAAEEGLCEPPPEKINPARSNSERMVIPPDPAILLGYAKAGDIAHPAALSSTDLHDKKHGHGRSHSQSKSPSPPGNSRSASESHMLLHQGIKPANEEKHTTPAHTNAGNSQSSRSAKQLPPVPTSPSRPVPLKTFSSPGPGHHKKTHSHASSSKSTRPSSPRKATDIDDEMTVPLNPHET